MTIRADRSSSELPLIAVWFALVTGLTEAALLTFARLRLGRYTHLPEDLIWISPAAMLILFGALALVLLGVGVLRPNLRSARVAVFVFAALGALDILFLITQLHKGAAVLLAIGIASQVVRIMTRFWPRIERLMRYSIGPLALVAVAGGLTMKLRSDAAERSALAALPASPTGSPNVLLIIWDTVRSLNLSLLGYDRPTTPRLEQLAHESVVFERALSTSPWTLPSHASMFTGAHPQHLSADWSSPLNDRLPTLAESFRSLGYVTAGFVANTYYCSEESGLDRGFVRYEDFRKASLSQTLTGSSLVRAVYSQERLRLLLRLHEEPGRKSAQRINDDMLAWLSKSDDRPFFVFLNYFDAHGPYLPPAPFDTMFGPKLRKRNPHISETRQLSAPEMRAEIDAYDGAIAYLDHKIGELLDALETRGVLNNTLVIVTSDHGEQFGEHGLIHHGNSLYLPALRVPLLIYARGRVPGGVRVPAWVTLRDLAATIHGIAAPGSPALFPGRSLARYWNGSTPEADTLLAAISRAPGLPKRYPASRGDLRSALAEPYQFIGNSDGTQELYDVHSDSLQLHNLLRVRAEPAARLRQVVETSNKQPAR